MNFQAVCPGCSNIILHHLSNRREYWFCRSCWQEPNLKKLRKNKYYRQNRTIYLLSDLLGYPKAVAIIK